MVEYHRSKIGKPYRSE